MECFQVKSTRASVLTVYHAFRNIDGISYWYKQRAPSLASITETEISYHILVYNMARSVRG